MAEIAAVAALAAAAAAAAALWKPSTFFLLREKRERGEVEKKGEAVRSPADDEETR